MDPIKKIDKVEIRDNTVYLDGKVYQTIQNSQVVILCETVGTITVCNSTENISSQGSNYNFVNSILGSIGGRSGPGTSSQQQNEVLVTVLGNVTNNVSVTSGNVSIGNNVECNVQSTSGKVSIGNNVEGNVQSTSGDIEIKGSVHKSVDSASGDITVSGSIEGSVRTTSGDINCSGNVNGDNITTSSGDIISVYNTGSRARDSKRKRSDDDAGKKKKKKRKVGKRDTDSE
jgi:hypothetical protein